MPDNNTEMTELWNKQNELMNYVRNNKISEKFGIISNIDETIKFDKFNRFNIKENDDYFTSSIGYIFFTKPDLNLNNDTIRNRYPFINVLNSSSNLSGKHILSSLSYSDTEYGSIVPSNFITLLTNAATSFESKDTTISTEEYFDTKNKSKMVFPITLSESETVDSFSIEYDEYSDLSIIYLHKVWIDYMHMVRQNVVQPFDTYITDKSIDYMSSAYYFKLAEDGFTIKYWSKYTGVFPTVIPYSAFSFSAGDNNVKKVNISYSYSFKEDMDINILADFSALCGTTYALPARIENNWASNVGISQDSKGQFRLIFGI